MYRPREKNHHNEFYKYMETIWNYMVDRNELFWMAACLTTLSTVGILGYILPLYIKIVQLLLIIIIIIIPTPESHFRWTEVDIVHYYHYTKGFCAIIAVDIFFGMCIRSIYTLSDGYVGILISSITPCIVYIAFKSAQYQAYYDPHNRHYRRKYD